MKARGLGMMEFYRAGLVFLDALSGGSAHFTPDCADGLAREGCVFFDGALGAHVARLAPDMHLIKVPVK